MILAIILLLIWVFFSTCRKNKKETIYLNVNEIIVNFKSHQNMDIQIADFSDYETKSIVYLTWLTQDKIWPENEILHLENVLIYQDQNNNWRWKLRPSSHLYMEKKYDNVDS